MKILLATAELEELSWAANHGLLDGVITSPALLGEHDGRERDLLGEICRLVDAPVYVTVHALDAEDVYRDAREIARLSDQIVIQVPLVEDSLGAIRRLAADGVRVAALLVFNAAQALLAAKAGASSVITSLDQLEQAGHDGVVVLRELRAVFDASGTECDIIATRPSSAAQFTACALAGADGVAVTPLVLRQMLVHPLTDRGIDHLLNELARQHAAWTVS